MARRLHLNKWTPEDNGGGKHFEMLSNLETAIPEAYCQRFNTDLAQLEVSEVYFGSAGTWEGFEENTFRSAQRFEGRHDTHTRVTGRGAQWEAPTGGQKLPKSEKMWTLTIT